MNAQIDDIIATLECKVAEADYDTLPGLVEALNAALAEFHLTEQNRQLYQEVLIRVDRVLADVTSKKRDVVSKIGKARAADLGIKAYKSI